MFGKPSRRLRKHLAEHGKRASAVVLDIAERGMAVTNGSEGVIGNTTLSLKTKLRVEPEGDLAFEVEQRFRYGQLSVPVAGMRIPVVYDPDDHDRIMLDEGAPMTYGVTQTFAAPAGATDVAALLATVQEAQRESGGDREQLAALLRERLGRDSVVVEDGGTFGLPAADPLDRLAKAAKLHEDGVLTDEEFAVQKAKILGDT